jgi:hypothetical protein
MKIIGRIFSVLLKSTRKKQFSTLQKSTAVTTFFLQRYFTCGFEINRPDPQDILDASKCTKVDIRKRFGHGTEVSEVICDI